MHSRWWHHVLSNGGVSTATSSGCPLSAVVSETSRKSPFSPPPLINSWSCRHPGVGTRAPQVGADAGQLWVRGARFIWTARFSLSSGARAAEWSPPCSSSCCTWWSRTSWSAAGCTTGNTKPSRASEPQDLCCAQGVFARACLPARVHVCFMDLSVLALVCWCASVHACSCRFSFLTWVCFYLWLCVRLRAFPNARVCAVCVSVFMPEWLGVCDSDVVLIMSGSSGCKWWRSLTGFNGSAMHSHITYSHIHKNKSTSYLVITRKEHFIMRKRSCNMRSSCLITR